MKHKNHIDTNCTRRRSYRRVCHQGCCRELCGVALLLTMLLLTGCGGVGESAENTAQSGDTGTVESEKHYITGNNSSVGQLIVSVNGQDFAVALAGSDTTLALCSRLPLTIEMEDLNGNEKYACLPFSLPRESETPGNINAGDIMLYGDNCLVMFYESFVSYYSYTAIGSVENPEDFAAALSNADKIEVTIRAD